MAVSNFSYLKFCLATVVMFRPRYTCMDIFLCQCLMANLLIFLKSYLKMHRTLKNTQMLVVEDTDFMLVRYPVHSCDNLISPRGSLWFTRNNLWLFYVSLSHVENTLTSFIRKNTKHFIRFRYFFRLMFIEHIL